MNVSLKKLWWILFALVVITVIALVVPLLLRRPPPLDVDVVVNSQGSPEELIVFRLLVTNRGDQEIRIPGRGYDFVVKDEGGSEVWSRSRPSLQAKAPSRGVFLPVLIRLAPDRPGEFVAEWGRLDRRGNPVTPGAYFVTGIFSGKGWKIESKPNQFRIERE